MRKIDPESLLCSSFDMLVDSEQEFVFGLNEGQAPTDPEADPI